MTGDLNEADNNFRIELSLDRTRANPLGNLSRDCLVWKMYFNGKLYGNDIPFLDIERWGRKIESAKETALVVSSRERQFEHGFFLGMPDEMVLYYSEDKDCNRGIFLSPSIIGTNYAKLFSYTNYPFQNSR